MVRLLNFYKSLSRVDKVNDMEIYLQSFGSYLWKASQVQLYLDELFNSLESYQLQHQELRPIPSQALQHHQVASVNSTNIPGSMNQAPFENAPPEYGSSKQFAATMPSRQPQGNPQQPALHSMHPHQQSMKTAPKHPMVRLPNPHGMTNAGGEKLQIIQN